MCVGKIRFGGPVYSESPNQEPMANGHSCQRSTIHVHELFILKFCLFLLDVDAFATGLLRISKSPGLGCMIDIFQVGVPESRSISTTLRDHVPQLALRRLSHHLLPRYSLWPDIHAHFKLPSKLPQQRHRLRCVRPSLFTRSPTISDELPYFFFSAPTLTVCAKMMPIP